MNAVNAVLFILVWTFTAVCQADDDVSVSCENVTGFVGKEVTLTCRVSLQNTDCCIKLYMFQYPERFNDSAICRKELPVNSCDQRNSFTCSYTPTTAMTEQFRFFVQTNCGRKRAEFTVDIPDSLKREGPVSKDTASKGTASKDTASKDTASKGTASKDTAIAAVVGCFSILLIIIIMMTIICKTKPNFTRPCGFQKRMFLCIKHDEDNSTPPEDVI